MSENIGKEFKKVLKAIQNNAENMIDELEKTTLVINATDEDVEEELLDEAVDNLLDDLLDKHFGK